MKISYIIPAYNEEAFIGRCLTALTSHIKDEPHDAEIIVVNTSTDRTKEIALSFPGVKVIDQPKNGLAAARKAGYLASTGDLIANIDADTMVTPGWSTKVFQYFKDDPKLAAVSGPFIYYDLPQTIRAAVYMYYSLGFLVYLVNRFILNVGSMIQGGNFVVRRTALDAIGGPDPKFEFYGEDIDLARRLHKVGGVKFTFDLQVMSSGRRLAAEGIVAMGIKYGLNYVWTIFRKKPFTKGADPIRVRPEEVSKILRNKHTKVS